MLRTLFIADVHLCKEEPAKTAGFLGFLDSISEDGVRPDALYILGDLFDVWTGDDIASAEPFYKQIATALNGLPFPVYFIHGNRDFLLGQDYACASGMIILPEIQVVMLYGKRILLLHGDTLCTDDKHYQLFRKIVQRSWIQKFFLALPRTVRECIAGHLRSGSKDATSRKASVIMDVNEDGVARVFHHYQTQWLIHGHTHRPGTHQVLLDGKSAQRITLGAWEAQGSLVQVDEQGVYLLHFPLTSPSTIANALQIEHKK